MRIRSPEVIDPAEYLDKLEELLKEGVPREELLSAIDGARHEVQRLIDDRAALYRQTQLADGTDSLYSKRAFYELLEQSIQEGRDDSWLVMADLDGFKAINDSQGHLEGDRAIRESAAYLFSSARMSDSVARVGGDEFGMLLRNAWPHEAETDEVLGGLSEIAYRFGTRMREMDWNLDISLGATPITNGNRLKIYERADRALYRAKDIKPAVAVNYNGLTARSLLHPPS